METEVWQAVAEILRHPELVIEEIKRRKGETSLLDQEARRLASAAKRLGDQERRLVRLYRFGEIHDAFISREVEQLRRQKAGIEAELISVQ